MKIYLIPGLGFDHRIFSKLKLDGFDVHYLDWIEPLNDEGIDSYSQRLTQEIDDDQEEVVLIGHSLGGLICQQVAPVKRIRKIVLISSAVSRSEITLLFRLVQPFRIYKLFTKELTVRTVGMWGKNHDYVSVEEQELFKDMVQRHSNEYLQWALKTLSVWKKPEALATTPIVRIHGGLDKTFPIQLIEHPGHVIKGGGHFMVYKHAEAINEIIVQELREP